MKRFIINALVATSVMVLVFAPADAREDRFPFRQQLSKIQDKNAVFKTDGSWFPYPAYSDHEAWDKLTAPYRNNIIKSGEKFLEHQWIAEPASEYLDYEKGINTARTVNKKSNDIALSTLIVAELTEGKGRFLPQIINGMYFYSQLPGWNTKRQSNRDRTRNRFLPDPEVRTIALTSSAIGAVVATGLHFFGEEFDKADPTITKVVRRSLEDNIFGPYLDETKDFNGHTWFGFGRLTNPHHRLGNWTTYTNTNCILAFLLAEQDQSKLVAAVEKCIKSVDLYMDYAKLDGSCEEGPSYWNMAGGKVYDLSRMLYDASDGKINMFGDEQLRRMGEWKSKTFIGDDWVTAFGDGQAHTRGDVAIQYRFGYDIGSREMMDFGIYLSTDPVKKKFNNELKIDNNDIFRHLETFRYSQLLMEAEEKALKDAGGDYDLMVKELRRNASSEWYGDNQVAVFRNPNGWYLAAKGGSNYESHNHNDVGTGVFYIDNCPVLIDAGVATYTKETFGANRYKAWNVQSGWHCVPVIGGKEQSTGSEFTASGCSCDIVKRRFTENIAGAYPAEAKCSIWQRNWVLGDRDLTITDSFALQERIAPDVENFIVQGKVSLPGDVVGGYKVKPGEVVILIRNFAATRTHLVRMTYPKSLTPSVEVKELTDKRLSKMWGPEIYRISFKSAGNAPLAGSYGFKLTQIN